MFSEQEKKELSKFGKKELDTASMGKISDINNACRQFMEVIYLSSPSCADQSAAIRSARLAAMQANAAVVWDTP